MMETLVVENDPALQGIHKYRHLTLKNFYALASSYEDRQYIEELSKFRRDDKEDLKRIVHALLLSEGSKGGWTMADLRTRVKEMRGYKDTREVDKFVKENFDFDNFDTFIRSSDGIARVDRFGNIHPKLDESNRDIYEDAVASVKNKDEKDRRKDERLAKTLEDPENIVEFYRGVNRVREAILRTYEMYRRSNRDNAFSEISERNGTKSTVIGVNYNFVCTEYERIHGRKLDDKECKLICGRSTLAKGLYQGQGPQCLIDTITMENKCGDDGKGMFIALKTGAREFTEEEIQLAKKECLKRNSSKQKRVKKWDDKDAKMRREWEAKHQAEARMEKQNELKKRLNEEVPKHQTTTAFPSSDPPSTSSAEPPSTTSSAESEARTTRAPAPPPNQQQSSNPRGMDSGSSGSEDGYSDMDSATEYGYSDESEDAKEQREGRNKKRNKRKLRRQRRLDRGRNQPRSPSPPAVQQQLQPGAVPPPAPSVVHDEVPYGKLPPAPYVIHYDENDDTIEEREAEEALHRALASTSISGSTRNRNDWEREEQQSPPTTANNTRGIFDPHPISDEAYQQPAMGQSIPRRGSYARDQMMTIRSHGEEQPQPQYDQQNFADPEDTPYEETSYEETNQGEESFSSQPYPHQHQQHEQYDPSQHYHYSSDLPPNQQPYQNYTWPSDTPEPTASHTQYDHGAADASYQHYSDVQAPSQQYYHDGSPVPPNSQFALQQPQQQMQQSYHHYHNGAPVHPQPGFGTPSTPGYASESPSPAPEYHDSQSAFQQYHQTQHQAYNSQYAQQKQPYYGSNPTVPGTSSTSDHNARPILPQSAFLPITAAAPAGSARYREDRRSGNSVYEDLLEKKLQLTRELAKIEEEKLQIEKELAKTDVKLERERERRRREREEKDRAKYRQSSNAHQPQSRGFGQIDGERIGGGWQEGRGHGQSSSRGFGDPNSGVRTERNFNDRRQGSGSGRGPAPRDDRDRHPSYGHSGTGRHETRGPTSTRHSRALENSNSSNSLSRSRGAVDRGRNTVDGRDTGSRNGSLSSWAVQSDEEGNYH